MPARSRILLDVRRLLRDPQFRRLGPKMRAALVDLGRLPLHGFRAVAERHGVDLGDLHRQASRVPGLLELRNGVGPELRVDRRVTRWARPESAKRTRPPQRPKQSQQAAAA